MDFEAVIATNDDASECKRGAVQLGYWTDNYIANFAKNTQRRAPEINRGYYARVKGMERLIKRFINRTGNESQIINLGCGYDTLYWRLKEDNVKAGNFIEVDFPAVTAKKCHTIKRNKQLLDKIYEQDGEVKLSNTDIHATNYHCLGVDLRNTAELDTKFQQAEVNFTRPTLFLAECVLVYIEHDCVNRLLRWIANKFPRAMFANYEMCNMNDHFGDIMQENMKARGCSLSGVIACKTMESQQARFTSNGWQGAKVWDMVKVYYGLADDERHRIEKLEFLDEQELLVQLFQHYCICIGWLGGDELADLVSIDDNEANG